LFSLGIGVAKLCDWENTAPTAAKGMGGRCRASKLSYRPALSPPLLQSIQHHRSPFIMAEVVGTVSAIVGLVAVLGKTANTLSSFRS